MSNPSILDRTANLILLLSLVASLLPASPAAAQEASLSLHPDSGDPPAARGALSGAGWCNPPSSVQVEGDGVTGEASIAPDGTLSGTFSVTGQAGDRVKITVVATCRGGGSEASARFRFNGSPPDTSTPIPVITRTPTPTFTPSPTPTPASSLTATPTSTLTPAPMVLFDQPLRLTIVGCAPQAAEVSIEFAALRPTLGGQGDIQQEDGQAQALPAGQVPVQSTGDPQVFAFFPPEVNPAWLYQLTPKLLTPCGFEGSETTDSDSSVTWIPGDPLDLTLVPPATSALHESNLGAKPPVNKKEEFGTIGAWVTFYETADSPAGYSQLFQWSTNLGAPTHGELQASVLPFPMDPASSFTLPPGVVFTKDVECVNCTFLADLSPLFPKNLLNQGTPSQNLLAKAKVFIKVSLGAVKLALNLLSSKLTGSGFSVAQGGLYPPSSGGPGDALTAGQGAPLLITDYYFRVVPKAGDQVVGAATNQVRIRFYADKFGFTLPDCVADPSAELCPKPIPPGPKPYIVEIISYHGVIPPSPGRANCYLVAKDTTLNELVYDNFFEGYLPKPVKHPVGESWCPVEKDESTGPFDWLADLVELVGDGLNWVSQAYSDLKSAVVETVAQFVPSELCNKKCLDVVLDGVLTSFGVPPSIPNFDQLMNQGMDYLAEQAIEQIPVPKEVTEGLVDEALKKAELDWKAKAEDQFKQGMQQGIEAAKVALSKSVSHVPDGLPVIPDPQGSVQPATVVLRITRDSSVEEAPGTCSMSSDAAQANLMVQSSITQSAITTAMQAFNDVHNGPGPGEGPDLTAGGLSKLYGFESVALPTLDPGESMTVPVVLLPVFTWGSGYGFLDPGAQAEAWAALYQGGQASLVVPSSKCVAGDGLTVQADGEWADVSGLEGLTD